MLMANSILLIMSPAVTEVVLAALCYYDLALDLSFYNWGTNMFLTAYNSNFSVHGSLNFY